MGVEDLGLVCGAKDEREGPRMGIEDFGWV